MLAGQGRLLNQMRELAANLGISNKVTFLGRCDRVPDLLAITDVAALSSTSEGFPNAVLEYMAAGCPVVATDVGGVREIINSAEMGCIVTPKDATAMSDSILMLLRNPSVARSLREAGRRTVTQRFSCRSQLDNVISLYQGRELQEIPAVRGMAATAGNGTSS